MPDFSAIAAGLNSPEALLAHCDEPQVFGAKKQAAAAYELWSQAESRYVGAYRGLQAPGGKGTGFVIRLFWDPTTTTPDLNAIDVAIQSALPIPMIRDDEKATYKNRDKKQGVFFTWQGMESRPLNAWFQERFGVSACTTQLFDESDLTQNVAVVAVEGGVQHLWTFTAE